MYFYKLNMSYESDSTDDGIDWISEVLMHEKEFTNDEFDNICKEVKDKCRESYGEVSLYVFEKIIKRDYGFKSLPITRSYDFEEEF